MPVGLLTFLSWASLDGSNGGASDSQGVGIRIFGLIKILTFLTGLLYTGLCKVSGSI